MSPGVSHHDTVAAEEFKAEGQTHRKGETPHAIQNTDTMIISSRDNLTLEEVDAAAAPPLARPRSVCLSASRALRAPRARFHALARTFFLSFDTFGPFAPRAPLVSQVDNFLLQFVGHEGN